MGQFWRDADRAKFSLSQTDLDLSNQIDHDLSSGKTISNDIKNILTHYLCESQRVSEEPDDERMVLSAMRRSMRHALQDELFRVEYRHARFCDTGYWDRYIEEKIDHLKEIT